MEGKREALFAGKPEASAISERLFAAAEANGEARVEVKSTCLHLCRRSAFAGVHPRKSGVLLNLRSAAPIESARIRKREQVSANRWHNELMVESAEAVDAELIGWMANAARLAE